MKSLYFYLFCDGKIHEILGLSSEEITRTELQETLPYPRNPEGASDLNGCETSARETLNFRMTDCHKTPTQSGDDVCSCHVKKTKSTNYPPKTVKAFRSKNMIPMDRYQLSYFVYLLDQSKVYRQLVFRNFTDSVELKGNLVQAKFKIKLSVTVPSYHILDYVWCRCLQRLCYERQELEIAMAWLSTLGGAFSALGEKAEHCAVLAGKISVRQLKHALRLGDPYTVARCKLWYSLSLIQQKKYRLAKYIIKEQYRIALAFPEKDFKLVRMCLGIWSKLKYEKNIEKQIEANPR